MVKIKDQIPEGLQEVLGKVTSKPKRRRIEAKIVASTEERKLKVLGEIKALDKRAIERGKMKAPLVPVLFLCGERKRLTEADAQWYKKMGSKVEYLPETEVKSLNIKY